MRVQIATLVTDFLKENVEAEVLVAGLEMRKTEAVQVQVGSGKCCHMQHALAGIGAGAGADTGIGTGTGRYVHVVADADADRRR